MECERIAREKAVRTRGTSEIILDQIYEEMAVATGLDAAELGRIKDLEIELELRCCYPNETIRQLFFEASKRGVQVVFCSDMYLPKNVLQEMLRNCGYGDNLEILVSGELRKSKHEGTIFPHLRDKWDVRYEEILHVGDNAGADVEQPKRLGIRTIHFRELEELARDDRGSRIASPSDHLVRSIIVGLTRKPLLSGQASGLHCLDNIGYEVFGPLFTGYFLWILEQIRRLEPEKVLFFARDAYLFHLLWTRYRDLIDIDTEASYAYVSRKAIFYPSFMDFDFDRLWKLTSGRVKRTLRERIEALGINPTDVMKTASELGLSMDEQMTGGDHRLFTLLTRHYDLVIQAAHEKSDLAKAYINQLFEGSSKVVMIDVGWTGSMQGAVSRLLDRRYPRNLTGLYFGLFQGASKEGLGSSMRAWLMNEGEPSTWRDAIASGGAELLELALTAPHGTTLGYRKGSDGTIEPVLESPSMNVDEQEYLLAAERLRSGALNFMEEYLRIFGVHSVSGTTYTTSEFWAAPFMNLVLHPSRSQAEALGDISHSDVGISTQRVALAKRISNKRDFDRELSNSFWKAGFKIRNSQTSGFRRRTMY